MAIQDDIAKLRSDVADAYEVIEQNGGIVPEHKNTDNLADAIATLIGQGGAEETINFETNPTAYAAIMGLDTDLAMKIVYLDEDETTSLLNVQYNMTPLNFFQVLEVAFAERAVNLDVETIGNNFLMKMNPASGQYEGTNINPIRITGMENLTSVKHIGNNFLFYQTYGTYNSALSLTHFSGFPPNLETIGDSCLRAQPTYNEDFNIPDSVTTIGNNFIYANPKFNSSIHFPESLTSLGSMCLYSNQDYNQPITFPASLETIPQNFLGSCSSFNQPIVVPGTVKTVGPNCFNGLSAFNSPVTFEDGVEEISAILGSNTMFNSSVTLPNTLKSLKSICGYCPKFNQPITLPASLETATGPLLYNLGDFTATITIECPVTVLDTLSTDKAQIFSASSNSVPAYTAGVTLAGTYASEWKNALPNTNTYGGYRKLILA